MRSLLIDLWIQMRASYWFVPACMAIGAVGLAGALVSLDAAYGTRWAEGPFLWLLVLQPDGSRLILSTIAGSMITVTGVTFSMTLLVVSHASGQIGPRLIAGFMRDRGTQLTLGAFVSTFLYCLLVLRAVQGGSGGERFVPHGAVLVGQVLAVASVFVLVYFIHHVSQTLNVSNIIAGVGDRLLACVAQEFPPASEQTESLELPEDFERRAVVVPLAARGGYVRVLDCDALVELGCQSDLIFEVLAPPGAFVSRGAPLFRAYPEDRLSEEVSQRAVEAFTWGNERTPEQDLLFLVDQLCEVAGRALSPGVNDPYTAFTCIDHLQRAFAALADRTTRNPLRADEHGNLRLILPAIEFGDLVDRALVPLRQFAAADNLAASHLMSMITRTSRLGIDPAIVERLVEHAEVLAREGAEVLPTSDQRRRLQRSYAELRSTISA